MNLLTIKADFTRLVVVLERIEVILERAFPAVIIPTPPSEPYGPEDLVCPTNEELWEMEAAAEEQRRLEQNSR